MFTIEVKFDADYLVRVLITGEHALEDKALLTSIGLALLNENNKRHEAEQEPSGKAWKPLKPATIKRKTNPRMLVEHGDMLRFYSRVDGDAVVVGTVDRKAYWHHAGTSRGLPARPLVGFEKADQELVIDLVEDYLRVILSRAR
jgi:phage virion morphogenesis protein